MVDVTKIVIGVVGLIVTFIVTFLLVGNTAADITTAADNISGSGLPLASLFGSNGIVLLIFMAGLLISLASIAFGFAKGK